MMNLHVFLTVSAPSVSIIAAPDQSNFYTGLRLNLTCLIQLATPTGYGVNISADWSKSGSTLTSDSRVSVGEEAVEVEPFLYSTSLVFSSLDQTVGDAGVYTCTVTVTPTGSDFHSPITAMASKLIQVQSKSVYSAKNNPVIIINSTAPLFQLRLLGIDDCQTWRVSLVIVLRTQMYCFVTPFHRLKISIQRTVI